MEHGIRQAVLTLANVVLTNWLRLHNDRYPPATIICRCKATAHEQERRDGVLLTAVGCMTYRRASYLCPVCHTGTYPLDERLGVRPGEISAALENVIANTGAHLLFGQAVTSLPGSPDSRCVPRPSTRPPKPIAPRSTRLKRPGARQAAIRRLFCGCNGRCSCRFPLAKDR